MRTGRSAYRCGILLPTAYPSRVLNYYLHTGRAPENVRGILTTYGVEVSLCDDSGCVLESATFADVTPDRERMIALLDALAEGTVTPLCLAEVLEDYVALQ